MKCPHCGTANTGIYKQYNRSGTLVVVERCPICRRPPNPQQAFLPKNGHNMEELPLFEDYSLEAEPCGVKGCKNRGVEYHHYAPRHLFEKADDWATGWLCREHHKEWHQKTKTGSYAKKEKIT